MTYFLQSLRGSSVLLTDTSLDRVIYSGRRIPQLVTGLLPGANQQACQPHPASTVGLTTRSSVLLRLPFQGRKCHLQPTAQRFSVIVS